MGRVGLPAPVSELCARRWDVVVVGGGHNGLTAAAYLARAGRSVLVLERRDRLGGACTLEEPFGAGGWHISPCAYLVGLLHPLVVEELDLRRYGYRVEVVDPHLWCPFTDGTSIALWEDPTRSAAAVAQLSSRDVDGYLAYGALFDRIRRALRKGERDVPTALFPGAQLGGDPRNGQPDPPEDEAAEEVGGRPNCGLRRYLFTHHRHANPVIRAAPAVRAVVRTG